MTRESATDTSCVRIALTGQLLADGYPAAQVASQLLDAILSDAPERLNTQQKAGIALTLAETDKSLTDGADEYLQLANLLSTVMRAVAAA